MAKDPAFTFYYKDVLVSCADWDADELGWYIRLLSHQADKPEGLPNDIESLATLAGVKFSQYNRFSECWKRTLVAKFEVNDKGLLVNIVQKEHLENRRRFKEKQTLRGTIGAIIKGLIKQGKYTEYQLNQCSEHLFKKFSVNIALQKDKQVLKQTLIAYAISFLGSVNANGNREEKENGVAGNPTTSVVPAMLNEFVSNNPGYPSNQETDFPALREVGNKIAKWLNLPGDITQNTDSVRRRWGELVTHIKAHQHFQTYSIPQINKHFQSIAQSFNNGTPAANRGFNTGGGNKPGTSDARIQAARDW